MKRCVVVLFVAVLVLAGFVSAGWAAGYKAEYNMSVVVGPTGPWGEGASRFAEAVRKYTNGRVNIKPYYNGRLFDGKQTSEFLLMRQGAIDFALGSTINWSTTVKELNLFSLPFFFHDYKALDAVEHGDPGKKIFKVIEEKGVVPLAWAENGFREFSNSRRAVKKADDLRGLKVRVVGLPIFGDTFKAMGADPVSIDWAEAMATFRQGVVDGQENPVVSVVIPNKLWQVHKYLTVWHYAIDPLIYAVSKEAWEGFTAEDKAAIGKAADEVGRWQKKAAREGLEGNMAAFDALKANGMEVTVLTRKEKQAFKAETKVVYDKWIPEIGLELVKAAEKAIAEAEPR